VWRNGHKTSGYQRVRVYRTLDVPGASAQDFAEFLTRLADLGLAHLKMLVPMCYFDITFYDYCLWSDDNMLTLEKHVHNILFPNVEFEWNDFCQTNSLDPSQPPSGRWRSWPQQRLEEVVRIRITDAGRRVIARPPRLRTFRPRLSDHPPLRRNAVSSASRPCEGRFQ
jgi:hypothetical protein